MGEQEKLIVSDYAKQIAKEAWRLIGTGRPALDVIAEGIQQGINAGSEEAIRNAQAELRR